MTKRNSLKRFLLVPALLAGELDAGRTLLRLEAVGSAAFAAGGLDPGVALFDDEGLLFHGLADQALGLLAHRLLRHQPHLSWNALAALLGLPLSHSGIGRHAASGVITARRSTCSRAARQLVDARAAIDAGSGETSRASPPVFSGDDIVTVEVDRPPRRAAHPKCGQIFDLLRPNLRERLPSTCNLLHEVLP